MSSKYLIFFCLLCSFINCCNAAVVGCYNSACGYVFPNRCPASTLVTSATQLNGVGVFGLFARCPAQTSCCGEFITNLRHYYLRNSSHLLAFPLEVLRMRGIFFFFSISHVQRRCPRAHSTPRTLEVAAPLTRASAAVALCPPLFRLSPAQRAPALAAALLVIARQTIFAHPVQASQSLGPAILPQAVHFAFVSTYSRLIYSHIVLV